MLEVGPTAEVLKVYQPLDIRFHPTAPHLRSYRVRMPLVRSRYRHHPVRRRRSLLPCRDVRLRAGMAQSRWPATGQADKTSVFGQTIIKGATVHIPDVLEKVAHYARPQAQKLMGLRAALGVPLVRG